MPPKRRPDYAQMSSKQKIWRESPPGPAQRELDRLFSDDIISGNEKPNEVQKQYPIFQEYSSKIFGLHFRKTKAKHGVYGKDVVNPTTINLNFLFYFS